MPVITNSEQLKERIKALENEAFITVDTEFLREKTYYPLLCLIQIAGADDCFAIDPLAPDLDMTPVWEIFQNPKIVKVFHACTQDLEIILYAKQNLPSPLFDSQIAAQILGYGESIGYGNLVTKICKIQLDKSSRHTDWSKRPLSDKQINYALSDVTHLRDIYLKLVDQLENRGRRSWFDEEMEKITDPSTYIPDPEEVWRKLKVKSGTDEYLSIVKQLAKWRELRAQKTDKPRNWVIKNDGIFEIASLAPKTIGELDNLRFFKTSNNDLRSEIVAVIKKAKTTEPPKLEKKKPLPKGAGPLVDLLKVLLKTQCDHHDIAPSVVARIDDLEKIATVKNLCENYPDIMAMHGWRFEIFGRFAISLEQGEMALTVEKGRISLIKPKYD